MGVLDDLQPYRQVRPCRIRTVLHGLEKDDAEKLEQAIGDPIKWPNLTLSKALKRLDISMSSDAISRHRTGVCSC